MVARIWLFPLLALTDFCLPGFALADAPAPTPTPFFTESTDSLRRYSPPTWFAEARVGLSVYWGVNSVPGRHLDYARRLYLPPERGEPNESSVYHQKHYGHPSVFGYKDLIPYWEAGAWDAETLAKRFKQSGVRYVIVLATDQDNFDLFASRHQSWNATRFGPERDIVGAWAKAFRAEGLPWGVAAHHGRAWWFLRPSHGSDWEGPYADQFYDGRQTARDGVDQWWEGLDPRDLYGPPRSGDPFAPEPTPSQSAVDRPSPAFQENWYLRLADLTRAYQPDLVWMRTPLPHGDWGRRWAAMFFESGRRGSGPQTSKVLLLPTSPNLPETAHVRHVSPNEPLPPPSLKVWQKEIWLAAEGLRTDLPAALSAAELQAEISTTASQGGNALIQIALRADGTLPPSQEAVLENLGHWLKINGEAIYGTNAGPLVKLPGAVSTSRDNGKILYIHVLPGLTARSLALPALSGIESATWLGGGPAALQADGKGQRLALPQSGAGESVRIVKLVVRQSESAPDF